MLRTRCALISVVLLVFFIPQKVDGDVFTYTSRSAFDVALAASGYSSHSVGFDSVATPYVVADGIAFDGLTFNYSFSGDVQLQISDFFATTSGPNSLGTDDGSATLQDGDSFSISFAARSAVGLYLITADSLVNGDLQLTVGSDAALLDASAVQQTLPDNAKVYFLGLLNNSDTFSLATLTTHGGGGAFTFNVDDVVLASATVPEPAFILPVTASLLLATRHCRRWRRQRTSISGC